VGPIDYFGAEHADVTERVAFERLFARAAAPR
jgi:hypothetical protein